MRKTIIYGLLCVGALASCVSQKEQKKELSCKTFEGNYVTKEYPQRGEGYDWSVVSIESPADTVAYISVRSRIDRKKPTCTYDGVGHLSATGDTLITEFEGKKIFFTLGGDTLSISSEDPNLLYYFCSGGATLQGEYYKLKEALDDSQLKRSFDGKKFTYPGSKVSFTTKVTKTELTIIPEGLTIANDPIKQDLTGYTINNIEIGDLNIDGSPELFIYLTSDGSGSYGKLIGYSVNNGKSMSEVYLPEIAENPKEGKGYMGHDEMAIVESTFCQRFPIYQEGDSNAQPTGKTRQIQYKLIDGESGRQLKIDKVIEY